MPLLLLFVQVGLNSTSAKKKSSKGYLKFFAYVVSNSLEHDQNKIRTKVHANSYSNIVASIFINISESYSARNCLSLFEEIGLQLASC